MTRPSLEIDCVIVDREILFSHCSCPVLGFMSVDQLIYSLPLELEEMVVIMKNVTQTQASFRGNS